MANYDQNVVSGDVTSWKRCNQMVIQNPLNGPPVAYFREEMAVALPGGSMVVSPPNPPTPDIAVAASDLSVTFNLIDPNSGSVVGTMSYAVLYTALYSLYLASAATRDAANV